MGSTSSSETEDIEVIDLVTDEDTEDKQLENVTDVKDDSVIICEEFENKRETRGSLNAAAVNNDPSNDEIVLLKEDKKESSESKLLEESDFTDEDDDISDDDSSVESVENEITLDLDKSETAEVTPKQDNEEEKKNSSSTNDDAATDKLNESLKIDLRPSWQVRNRKSSFVKSGQESTASI